MVNKTANTQFNKVLVEKEKKKITLNVSGLNAPTKRQRLAEGIQKQDPRL